VTDVTGAAVTNESICAEIYDGTSGAGGQALAGTASPWKGGPDNRGADSRGHRRTKSFLSVRAFLLNRRAINLPRCWRGNHHRRRLNVHRRRRSGPVSPEEHDADQRAEHFIAHAPIVGKDITGTLGARRDLGDRCAYGVAPVVAARRGLCLDGEN
jgi:hypothetical protein